MLFSKKVMSDLVGADNARCMFKGDACSYGFDQKVRNAIACAVWASCSGLVVSIIEKGVYTDDEAAFFMSPAEIVTFERSTREEKLSQMMKYHYRSAQLRFKDVFRVCWDRQDAPKHPLLFISSFTLGLALVDSLLAAASAKCCGKREVFDILCVRPFREYTMGSGILLKKGSELGNTFRGWADFQLTDNIIAKTHIGHFTFWHASIVTNPKCLFLAEDIFCTNYIRGEGKVPLRWQYADHFKEDPMGTMQTHDASIICLPIPLGSMDPASHRLSMNNPISLNSKLIEHSEKFGQNTSNVKIGMVSCEQPEYLENDTTQSTLNTHYKNTFLDAKASAEHSREFTRMFNDVWGFDKLNNWVDIESANTFETSGNLINTMCFHTMQKFQNPSNKRWEVTNLNTGHFGENGIYEGVKRIRCGFIDYFKEMDYQKSMAMGGMNI